ncbi:Uncharacterized protein dnm_097240 [Desulfonema magnum]|uniref:Uncharacterized protein n=1 Tax=Desulfonema magnum TaxID=45655 RepID=A0A975BXU6_9BACT|nr:Uncharacterized protein dnm_097240 [Desulfonema magnum]
MNINYFFYPIPQKLKINNPILSINAPKNEEQQIRELTINHFDKADIL